MHTHMCVHTHTHTWVLVKLVKSEWVLWVCPCRYPGSDCVVVVFLLLSLSCVRLFRDSMDCSPSGSSAYGISQARILEWLAISSSKGSSQSRDQTHISYSSCFGRQILNHWANWEAQIFPILIYFLKLMHLILSHLVVFFFKWYLTYHLRGRNPPRMKHRMWYLSSFC